MATDGQKLLHESLLRQYDLIMDRRKTLTGQAATLITFAGIIQTILVGLLTTLATNSMAKAALATNPNYNTIVLWIDLGFVMFLLTVAAAIVTYAERKWTPAPIPVNEKDLPGQRAKLDALYVALPADFQKGLDVQLLLGINRHVATNRWKYWMLFSGFVFLSLGILFTALAGLYVVAGISS